MRLHTNYDDDGDDGDDDGDDDDDMALAQRARMTNTVPGMVFAIALPKDCSKNYHPQGQYWSTLPSTWDRDVRGNLHRIVEAY